MRTNAARRALALPILSLLALGSAVVIAAAPADAAVHNGCWRDTVAYKEKAVAGNTTGVAYTTGEWCVLGIVGNASYRSSWAETSTPGWSMSGIKGHGAGVVDNSARIWSEYKMTFKLTWFTVQESTLCPRVYGSVSGQGHASYGCSIY